MASLREQLESLTQTAPAVPDLEDPDDADGTTAALRASLKKATEDDSSESSQMRRRIGGLQINDEEGRYAGVPASRSDIFGDDAGISGLADHFEDDDEDSEEDDSEEEVEEEEVEGEMLRRAHKSKAMTDLTGLRKGKAAPESDEESGGESGDDGESMEDGDEDEDASMDEEYDESKDVSSEKNKETVLKTAEILPSVDVSMDAQKRKGLAVRNQLALWDQFLLLRIRLHAALKVHSVHFVLCVQAFNELPRGDLARTLFKQADDETKHQLKKARQNMLQVVSVLLDVEDALLRGCPQTKSIVSTSKTNGDAKFADSDDDEIESSEDEKDGEKNGDVDFDDDSGADTPDYKGSGGEESGEEEEPLPKKKKKKTGRLTLETLAKRLQESERRFELFRKATLSKWDERTRLVAPSKKGAAKKDFSAFEGSVLQQIEKVMSDQKRLLRRIRQKRSDVERIGGDAEADEDEERFDDDDFYQQLLKELIERKTAAANATNDPAAMSRQWLELEKLRSKRAKKKKASKGRKIRYVTIPKLVNYQNSVPEAVEWTHEARNELFKSLFA